MLYAITSQRTVELWMGRGNSKVLADLLELGNCFILHQAYHQLDHLRKRKTLKMERSEESPPHTPGWCWSSSDGWTAVWRRGPSLAATLSHPPISFSPFPSKPCSFDPHFLELGSSCRWYNCILLRYWCWCIPLNKLGHSTIWFQGMLAQLKKENANGKIRRITSSHSWLMLIKLSWMDGRLKARSLSRGNLFTFSNFSLGLQTLLILPSFPWTGFFL